MNDNNVLIDNPESSKGPVFDVEKLSYNDVILMNRKDSVYTTRFKVIAVHETKIQMETFPLNGTTPVAKVLSLDDVREVGFVHIGTKNGALKRFFGMDVKKF